MGIVPTIKTLQKVECMFFLLNRGIAVGQSSILSAEEIAKEALDAKADVVVVENEELLKRVLLIQHKLPELKAIVQIKGEPPVSDKRRLNRTHKVKTFLFMFMMLLLLLSLLLFLLLPLLLLLMLLKF